MKILLLIGIIVLTNVSFGQSNTTLDSLLKTDYPENSQLNYRLVFYSKKANIERLEVPLLKQYLSNYDFLCIDMAVYGSPYVKTGRCVILFDSTNKTYLLHKPLWMDGLDTGFIKVLKKIYFKDSISLSNFITDFHSLRQIGSKYKFIQVAASDSLLSYHVVFFKDQNYLIKPYSETTASNYKNDQIQGKFFIKVENNRIKEYIEKNEDSK